MSNVLGERVEIERIFSEQEAKDFIQLMDVFDGDPTPCATFPEAWFPENEGDHQLIPLAKKICADCPAVALCAEYGLKYADDGIWGGVTAKERAALKRAHQNSRSVVCAKLGCRKPRATHGLCAKHYTELADISVRAAALFTTA